MNSTIKEQASHTVNGKKYSLWPQFVEKKADWIGGRLQELTSGFPETGFAETEITDIKFRPNGDDSAWFEVVGKDFGCGFDVRYGGVIGGGVPGSITFSGYGGHTWRIHKPEGNSGSGNPRVTNTHVQPQPKSESSAATSGDR